MFAVMSTLRAQSSASSRKLHLAQSMCRPTASALTTTTSTLPLQRVMVPFKSTTCSLAKWATFAMKTCRMPCQRQSSGQYFFSHVFCILYRVINFQKLSMLVTAVYVDNVLTSYARHLLWANLRSKFCYQLQTTYLDKQLESISKMNDNI